VIDPDRTPSAFILSFIVVLIELVNEFNDPVLVSIESALFFKLSVVVATLDDKLPILELTSFVNVDTLELKLPKLELIPPVVVATEELNEPILEDILELNVEYPVVPVILT
jgi:hypothetical protein